MRKQQEVHWTPPWKQPMLRNFASISSFDPHYTATTQTMAICITRTIFELPAISVSIRLEWEGAEMCDGARPSRVGDITPDQAIADFAEVMQHPEWSGTENSEAA